MITLLTAATILTTQPKTRHVSCAQKPVTAARIIPHKRLRSDLRFTAGTNHLRVTITTRRSSGALMYRDTVTGYTDIGTPVSVWTLEQLPLDTPRQQLTVTHTVTGRDCIPYTSTRHVQTP